MSDKIRVIQWGMGHVGTAAIRMMLQKESIELVGAIVSREEKSGKDIGELVGYKNIGINASNDAEKVLKVDADAVFLATAASIGTEGTWDENVRQVSSALKASKNVVTTAGFLYPWKNHPQMSQDLDSLAKKHGVSLLGTGACPGFHTDFLPLALSGCMARVDKVIVRECEDDSFVDGTLWLSTTMGFGLTPEEFEKQAAGTLAKFMVDLMSEPVHYIADGLGWELTELRPTHKYFTATEPLKTVALEVAPGTICSHQFIIEAFIEDNVVISVEHSFKICPDKVKEPADGSYIRLEGRPSIETELKGNFWPWAMLTTTAHAVNTIPVVVKAQPGLVTMPELPLVTALK